MPSSTQAVKRPRHWGTLALGLLGLLLVGSPGPTLNRDSTPGTRHQTLHAPRATLMASYGKLPLSFEANQGQSDNRVKFLSRGRGYTLFLTGTEAVLALNQPQRTPRTRRESFMPSSAVQLRLRLLGANPQPEMRGLEELPGKSNYFIGNDPSKWRTNVPTYGKVEYRDVYPGVNLVYYGNGRQLEHDFVVAPGADPNVIRLAVEGADKMELDAEGDLVLHASGTEARLRKPMVYQEVDGARREIPAMYRWRPAGRPLPVSSSVPTRHAGPAGGTPAVQQIAFEIGPYDAARPLVIDPVLVYSTYLGGASEDLGYGIAVDSAGNAYVVGETSSINFPTATPLQGVNAGYSDAFIAKLNATGSALVYSTYLGGSGQDIGYSIALDSSGNAYLTGHTNSPNFPTVSPLQPRYGGGGWDAFVTKLNPAGSALVYSTYLGGSDQDMGYSIAVDWVGNAYVTGYTWSTNFPTASPLQAAHGGGVFDAFVAKLNATGSALIYSTYLGGSGWDGGSGIAVDASGNAYVTGYTYSTNFPTASPLQAALYSSNSDAFVAKLNAAGSALVYSTYLGGIGSDYGYGIAVDSSGNAYVTGFASWDFPTANPVPAAYGGGGDAFVLKLNASGSALLYSTHLGGSDSDLGSGIAVDSAGNAYVTGYTWSTNFPTATPLQAVYGGGRDAFVTKLNASGSALVYSTYMGGRSADTGYGIAVDASGNAYVTGGTLSTDFPTASAAQPAFGGGSSDAFIAKISGLAAACTYSIAPTAQSTGASGGTGSVTVTAPFGCTWTATSNATWITITSGASGSGNGTVGYSAAANRTNDVRTGNLTIAGLGFVVTQAASSLPMITSMSPTSAVVGGDSFVLTLKGHNFVTGSVVRWNQTSLPTTFVSTSELQALVSRANLTTAGNIAVTVSNPGTDGGTSDAFTFPLMYPPATLSLLVPSSLSLPGADSFVLTVKGGTFVAGSVIRWNGSDRPTVFLNSGELQALISASDAANPGTVSITVFHPLQVAGNALNFVICASCPQRFPSINASGIVNGASFNASVAGGSIASVFGTNLASSESFASSVPLPTTLGGGTVQINGIPAPLFYVSPAQINFQAPWELLGQSQASITVTVAGVTSTAQAINIAAFAPGLFAVNSQGTGQGAVLIAATGEIAAPLGSIAGRATRPVQRGEYLSIYCSGLGPVANQPVNGAASPANALPTTMNTPTVTIGGVTAIVSFSGLAPGFVALYQVNVQVPDNAPTGNAVSVVLTIGGATSNTVTVAVQ